MDIESKLCDMSLQLGKLIQTVEAIKGTGDRCIESMYETKEKLDEHDIRIRTNAKVIDRVIVSLIGVITTVTLTIVMRIVNGA